MHTDEQQRFVGDLAIQYGGRLRRFLASRLRNAADVHDLAQEVFLRLLRIGGWEKIRSPEAYLITIAGHVLQQHALKDELRPQPMDITDAMLETSAPEEADPVTHLHLQRRLEALERALTRLSAKTRTAFLLQRRDGCTLDEIAQRMGISRSMVKKHLAKAVLQCHRQVHDIHQQR